MTCRDFESEWNERFDALAEAGSGAAADLGCSGPAQSSLECTLEDHEAECPACLRKAAQFRALERAIRAWSQPPAAPATLADRVAAEIDRPSPSAWAVYAPSRRSFWTSRTAALVAAAVLAAMLLVAVFLPDPPQRGRRRVVLHPTPLENPSKRQNDSKSDSTEPGKGLGSALANASAATWDLARSASLPAARITRQVIDVATAQRQTSAVDSGGEMRRESGTGPISVPSLELLAPDSAAAAAALQQVSDSVALGVLPWTTSARQAFGFLLGPPPAKPDRRTPVTSEKGA